MCICSSSAADVFRQPGGVQTNSASKCWYRVDTSFYETRDLLWCRSTPTLCSQ